LSRKYRLLCWSFAALSRFVTYVVSPPGVVVEQHDRVDTERPVGLLAVPPVEVEMFLSDDVLGVPRVLLETRPAEQTDVRDELVGDERVTGDTLNGLFTLHIPDEHALAPEQVVTGAADLATLEQQSRDTAEVRSGLELVTESVDIRRHLVVTVHDQEVRLVARRHDAVAPVAESGIVLEVEHLQVEPVTVLVQRGLLVTGLAIVGDVHRVDRRAIDRVEQPRQPTSPREHLRPQRNL
jgi:hypothetical protein